MSKLDELLKEIGKCTNCINDLPLPPKPILRVRETAKILIIGQAPGIRAHNSSTPWNDPSGDRLRIWLGIEREDFYNDQHIAIMPMGFCYPGTDKNAGDKPPRKECSALWHQKIKRLLPNIKLTILVGSYAQKYYLKNHIKPNMTQTVAAWQEYLPEYFPLPHPSWRNSAWLNKNPWFTELLLPELQKIAKNLL